MYKKVLSMMLSLFLVMGYGLPAAAAETEQTHYVQIHNRKNLERLAENCRLDSYSADLVVSLQADLDLTESDFAGIPIFCGRFEGNGHTIRGLQITGEGSDQGFFRYLTEGAEVNTLHLEGKVQPSGTANGVGGFVGKNSGTLRNCSFSGTVSGKECIGGIAGENTVTGTIESCHISGSVYGDHFVGGIVGQNSGAVRSCENDAAINETPQQNQVELSDVTLDLLLHAEAANTVTDVGGIAGNSTGFIRGCVNRGTVGHTSMGYNIGGIAGTQSGTILDCENRGEIFGRKEVGGIAGQMEPSAVMEFEEDALQILTRQLNGLGKAVSKASSNLQGAGESILSKMDGMYDYIGQAQNAVQTLVPDLENQYIPDLDTIQAARNNIGSSLRGMGHLMEGVGATAYSALGKVSSNLQGINDEINAMRTTIGNISETTGGSVVDRSDEDTEEDLSGKVAQCRNYGDVQGDLNCGGIAGAIALENDLDVEEDWLVKGENSLNFESELRAVVLDCENSGSIAAGKQNAGGIVGLQSLGLVKESRNTGKLQSEQADYVGGISGRSTGFIRSCYANGEILGAEYVGGIAGAAAVATNCRALVQIGSGTEKLGAVLGSREENRGEVKDPLRENYYLPIRKDPGAIDGVSYEGLAQPLGEEEFFLLEGLPQIFRQVTVTFRYGNGTERCFPVEFGGAFPEEWIPPIPPKDGRQSYWEGLAEADLSGIFFDMVFAQEYTNQTTVLESDLTRGEIPLLLIRGIFQENATVQVEQAEAMPPVQQGEKLLEAWQFRTTEPANQTQIRLQLPEAVDAERIRILLRGSDGSWREEAHHVLGRYGVVSLNAGDDAIALIQEGGLSWPLILGAVCVIAVAGIPFWRKRQKK